MKDTHIRDLNQIKSKIKYLNDMGLFYSLNRYLNFIRPVLTKKNMISLGFFNSLLARDDDDKAPKLAAEPVTYPFIRIPNVSSFKVRVKNFEEFFALHGIKKRKEPDFTWFKYYNKRMNRYIEHQSLRLFKAKSNNEDLFWRIACWSVKRSRCFFISQLMRTSPNWHRNMPLWLVIRTYKRYQRLANTFNTRLKFNRVFIPKADPSQLRPLGVPSLEWRILLSLWSRIFYIRFGDRISDMQHGFQIGRGTLTAWIDILRYVKDAKDIWEFDLIKFFDRVSIAWFRAFLLRHNIPAPIVNYFSMINIRVPNKVKVKDKWHPWSTKYEFEPIEDEDLILVQNMDTAWASKNLGFPQGASTSPFFSSLFLEDYIFKRFKGTSSYWTTILYPTNLIIASLTFIMFYVSTECCEWLKHPLFVQWVYFAFLAEDKDWGYGNKGTYQPLMYADDGLIFGDLTGFKVPPLGDGMDAYHMISPTGFHPLKSGWVKKDGKWLKPLKFLGLELFEDQLRAHTRKGSRLIYNMDELVKLWDRGEIETKTSASKPNSLQNLANSEIFGLIQARLYSGKWNEESLQQDFRLTFTKGSWVDKYKHSPLPEKITVFNSSSFAAYSLSSILKRKGYKLKVGAYGPIGKYDDMGRFQIPGLLWYNDSFLCSNPQYYDGILDLWKHHNEPIIEP